MDIMQIVIMAVEKYTVEFGNIGINTRIKP
jgi:hypothetical protein